MLRERDGRGSRRRGTTSPVVVLLLSGILTALVVLIVVLLTGRGGAGLQPGPQASPNRSAAAVADGRTIARSELAAPPRRPSPIDDPERIKETLQEGRTYRVVLKAGLESRVEDKAWGLKQVVNLAYAAEMQIDRTIEKNDGKRVVELRRFARSRNVKLLCDVESVTIDLGTPGMLLLGGLDSLVPGTTETMVMVQPIAEALLRYDAQSRSRGEATKAVAHVDTLAGKQVRITYRDGVGVEAIQPVGCTLTEEERDFVFNTAVLSDCSIWDMKKAIGERWTVDGSELSGFIDPSLRGSTAGEIGFVRDADGQEDGRKFASLRIEEGGSLTINSSDASTRRIGNFSPEGTLRYSLVDKVVERARLVGRFHVEEVSTDHILFETRFKTRPTLTIEYACSVQ